MLAIDEKHIAARYGGYVLTMQCSCSFPEWKYTTNILAVPICVLFIITFLTGGVGGSTKKFAFGVAYQLGYAVGNIIGPQTFRQDDAPEYYVSR